MCDPSLIQYKSGISVLYVCTNRYLIGHVVPNEMGGYKFKPLSNMPGGRVVIEYGGGAGKGFYQASMDRYLLWMMSEGPSHPLKYPDPANNPNGPL